MDLENSFALVYSLVLLCSGAALALLFRRILKRAAKQRINRVRQRKKFDAIQTETPHDEPKKEAANQGINSIRHRFTVMQRMAFIVLAVFTLAALSLPFLTIIPATLVSLVIGSFTVMMGIAAKPLIENVIAGIVISFSQPVRIGDTVKIDGEYGTIESISLTYSVVKLWDWKRYIIPNHKLLNKEVLNLSLIDGYQWSAVKFYVDPQCDLAQVQRLAIEAARSSQFYQSYEAPSFWVIQMHKEAIECWIAAWTDTPSDAWGFRHETAMRLSALMRENELGFHRSRVQLDPKQTTA